MQDQIGIRRRVQLYVLLFSRSIYQFAKPTTKLGIENVFNAIGALMRQRMKLLSQQDPFMTSTITRHTLCPQISWRSPFNCCSMSQFMPDVGANLTCRCKPQDREHERDGGSGYHKDHNVLVGKKHGFHNRASVAMSD